MPLSYKEIAEILKIIDASDCEELVVEMDDFRLVVRRGGAGGGVEASYSDGQGRLSGAAETFESGMAPPTRAEPGGDAADAARPEGMILVHAPMVGTFYRAASPQDPPFVEIGDKVAPGDPLCLIEVMKLFTTIDAEQAGRIVEIGAENEAMVEHDQVLFVIDPA